MQEKTTWLLFAVLLFISYPEHPSSGKHNRAFWKDNHSNASSGKTYYVSKNGNDSNPGTRSRPWLTIGKAAQTASAGDTVYIKKGTYSERVVPQKSGSPGNYITYAAYAGHTVTIDGSGISLPGWGGLFEVSGKSYLKISGLRIINAGPKDNNAGILVDNSNHVIIEKNYTYNTASSGIGVWNSKHVIIDRNGVELACNDGEQECITVAGTDQFEVKNNHVHYGGPGSKGAEGIDAKDGSSNGKVYKNYVHHMNRVGIYVDAWNKHTYNIEVFQNIIHDCEADGLAIASETGGLLENIRVYNNIAYNNKYAGITIGGWLKRVKKHPMKNITIINNTFYNNGRGDWGGGISVENQDAKNLTIRNNILSQNLLFQILVEVSMEKFTADYNLIDGYRGYPKEIYGDNAVKGDPRFVNSSEANFHLQKNSPAIDSGSPKEAPKNDFDGNSRPRGAGFDIGAYEYGPKAKGSEIKLSRNSLCFTGKKGSSNPDSQYFEVKNSGQKKLKYKIRPDKKWIKATPRRGKSRGEWDKIRVRVEISSLKAGNYSGIVQVTSKNALNSPQQVRIELTIQ